MGAGYHGGFGATKGSRSVIAADSTLVGNGKGFRLKEAARRVKKIEGYTDVAVHGSPDSISLNFILPNGEMVIGPNWRTNSGRWIDYYPQKGAKK